MCTECNIYFWASLHPPPPPSLNFIAAVVIMGGDVLCHNLANLYFPICTDIGGSGAAGEDGNIGGGGEAREDSDIGGGGEAGDGGDIGGGAGEDSDIGWW